MQSWDRLFTPRKSPQGPAVGLEAGEIFWGKIKFISLMAVRNPAFTVSHFHLKKKRKLRKILLTVLSLLS